MFGWNWFYSESRLNQNLPTMQRPWCKNGWDFPKILNWFCIKKLVDTVHYSVDHRRCGPWWTNHHGWYRAPPELGHGPLWVSGARRDGGERKTMMSWFHFASYRQRRGCSSERFDNSDWSSSERRRKRGGGELVAKMWYIRPRWGWSRPSKLRPPGSPTVPQYTQLSERPNPPKRLVQWGKCGSPF
jgi:hypothetical protein